MIVAATTRSVGATVHTVFVISTYTFFIIVLVVLTIATDFLSMAVGVAMYLLYVVMLLESHSTRLLNVEQMDIPAFIEKLVTICPPSANVNAYAEQCIALIPAYAGQNI